MKIHRLLLPILLFGLLSHGASAAVVHEGAADIRSASNSCFGVQARDHLAATLLPGKLKGNPNTTTLSLIFGGKVHSMAVKGGKSLADGRKMTVSFHREDGRIGTYEMKYKAKSVDPDPIVKKTKEVAADLILTGFGGVEDCKVKLDLFFLKL